MNKLRIAVAALSAAALLPVSAYADDGNNPLSATIGLAGNLISVATDRLPKGWWTIKNSFVNSKTNLQTTAGIGATSCSAGAGTIATQNSNAGDGAFTPNKNPQGKTNGYFYATSVGVNTAAYANHWNRHIHCDGSITIDGCNAATPVNVAITAYGKTGCRTYADQSGVEQCASASATLSIAAIQGADVTDTCGAGSCVQSCHATCDATYGTCAPGRAGQACHQAKAKCKAACGQSCK